MSLVVLKLPCREGDSPILCSDHVDIIANGDMVATDVDVPRFHEREVSSQRFKVRGGEMSAIPVFIVGVKFIEPVRSMISNHAHCRALGYENSVTNIRSE